MPLRRPRRFAGFSYRGRYRYLLTLCTANRARLFTETELVRAALARIQQTALETGFSILAYCFMPDHLHLIVEGSREDADLRRFVKIAKQRVVYSLREDHGVRGVWQEGRIPCELAWSSKPLTSATAARTLRVREIGSPRTVQTGGCDT